MTLTRIMTIGERREQATLGTDPLTGQITVTGQTTVFELRKPNGVGVADDRLTLVCSGGDSIPAWSVGQMVTVTIVESATL